MSALTDSSNAQGLDVSHYQGAVDWNSVTGAGASFAYMKATEGTTYIDPQFATNYAGSANAGLSRGAYHFALPDTSTGAAQATFFLDNGGGWVGDGHTAPPVLDIEYNPYGSADWTGWCYNMTPAQMVTWITDFTTTIHNRTNQWPLIYTTNGWWTNCTGSNTTIPANSPLWISRIGDDPGTIPAGWSSYAIWQYDTAGTFPGDQDTFNGTVDQVHAFAQGSVPDQIVAHYTALGGTGSSLGNPVGAEYPIAKGWAQNYEHGTIYYTPNTGAWAVQGAILTRYQQLGGPGGSLGFPTSDTTGTGDGAGQYTTFGAASLYYSPNTDTHTIQGDIRTKWLALGGVQTLGYPTTDESSAADSVGRYNHFSLADGASVYWTPSTGAHGIQGAIRDKWSALGWETGIGYPTTDESSAADSVGRYNDFSHPDGASIYFSVPSGAHEIQGAIRTKWQALGGVTFLGYPTTDESITPDGIGHYNHFHIAAGDASVYWTPSTGAHSIQGAIRDKWSALGWETSALGYPTSDEYNVTGGRRNDFQHGYITWFSADGSTQVTYT